MQNWSGENGYVTLTKIKYQRKVGKNTKYKNLYKRGEWNNLRNFKSNVHTSKESKSWGDIKAKVNDSSGMHGSVQAAA